MRYLIEEQNVDLTQMTLGLNFKLPLTMARGSLDLTGGGVDDSDFEGGRGRAELGLNYANEGGNGNGNGITATAATFYDGISTDYESYSANFSVGMKF